MIQIHLLNCVRKYLVLNMKDFKPTVKMQAGGLVGMGVGQHSGPMGVAAPNEQFQPGRQPGPRIGYKAGGQTKKRGK